MITARNEFETVPAFTHIAGCSLGTWTDRETTIEMLSVLDTVQNQVDVNALYKVLAGIADHQTDFMFDLQSEIENHLNYYMPMPEYCYVTLDNNEWRVIPCIENASEECESFEDIPETRQGDTILVVNDHGNVTCMQWDYPSSEYVSIWDMV